MTDSQRKQEIKRLREENTNLRNQLQMYDKILQSILEIDESGAICVKTDFDTSSKLKSILSRTSV